ncbi:DUF58 domain-containing protein [Tahibacter amnicola]|uniref:DUF58 domain-containing protein n=1 Tax=Tahibacter amnicola TaxID=2976241 RepID=A0ABY6BMF3_9GAMM|nr:DUF58 domain-containing protein [Tahibacter amnicola]UXI68997.1 DUF58 domain-containing protein [Tahibacter amnicola]
MARVIATGSAHGVGAGIAVGLDELLSQRLAARSLVLAASRKVVASQAGIKSSRFRGRGVDYVESRIYQPGDDIRSMDWRVTARSGRPHTKVFQEERERSVLLVMDHNPSMHFGTRVRFKSVQAARAAALVAWSAVRGGDRVGAVGFGNGVNGEVRPAGGPRGALHCLRALVEWDGIARSVGDAPAPLSEGLERTRRLARPGSLIILLTDGFSADVAAEAPLARLAAHGEVRVLLMTDVLELSPPPRGRYAVAVGNQRRWFDFGDNHHDSAWTDAFRRRRALLAEQARRLGVALLPLDTRDDLTRRMAPLGLALATHRNVG